MSALIDSLLCWLNDNEPLAGWAQAVATGVALVVTFWIAHRDSRERGREREAQRRKDEIHAASIRHAVRYDISQICDQSANIVHLLKRCSETDFDDTYVGHVNRVATISIGSMISTYLPQLHVLGDDGKAITDLLALVDKWNVAIDELRGRNEMKGGGKVLTKEGLQRELNTQGLGILNQVAVAALLRLYGHYQPPVDGEQTDSKQEK